MRAGCWVGRLGVLEDKDRWAAWQCHQGTRRRGGDRGLWEGMCLGHRALEPQWEETDSGQFNLF